MTASTTLADREKSGEEKKEAEERQKLKDSNERIAEARKKAENERAAGQIAFNFRAGYQKTHGEAYKGFTQLDKSTLDPEENRYGQAILKTSNNDYRGSPKDGVWASDKDNKYQFEISGNTIKSLYAPKNKDEYRQMCQEMLKLWKGEKGLTHVKLDWDDQKFLSEEKIKIYLEEAQKAGVTVEFGRNIKEFLKSNQKDVSFKPTASFAQGQLRYKHMEGAISDKERASRMQRISQMLALHNDAVGGNLAYKAQNPTSEEIANDKNYEYAHARKSMEEDGRSDIGSNEKAKTDYVDQFKQKDRDTKLTEELDRLESRLQRLEDVNDSMQKEVEGYKDTIGHIEDKKTPPETIESIKSVMESTASTRDALLKRMEQEHIELKIRNDVLKSAMSKETDPKLTERASKIEGQLAQLKTEIKTEIKAESGNTPSQQSPQVGQLDKLKQDISQLTGPAINQGSIAYAIEQAQKQQQTAKPT